MEIKLNAKRNQIIQNKHERGKNVIITNESNEKLLANNLFNLKHSDNYIKYKWSKYSN